MLDRLKWTLFAWMAVALFSAGAPARAAELKIGVIGLDTSHVTAFTELLNNAGNADHVPGARVVAAFKGGSPDLEASRSRVDGFTQTLVEKYGVEMVPTIEQLCQKVDAVMLESVDGRPHLEQVRPVFEAGKPVFIDKPVAGSLRDAIEIYRLAREHAVPCFSSSAYRFYGSLTDLKAARIGDLRGAISYGPAPREPTHPDLFWYGVHPVEALFTVLGTGCESVVRSSSVYADVVTGTWSDGKIGTLHGLLMPPYRHKVIVFGSEGVAVQEEGGSYAPLVREIVQFFQTGRPPVAPEETIEMFAFMEAADESKRRGGTPVTIREIMEKNGG